ncbi:hypothetical protein ACNKHR_07375 [Shigella flexneri]
MTKLIFDRESHRVIGGAIVGTNGGELLGEIACNSKWVVMLKTSHSRSRRTPTLHESVGLCRSVRR